MLRERPLSGLPGAFLYETRKNRVNQEQVIVVPAADVILSIYLLEVNDRGLSPGAVRFALTEAAQMSALPFGTVTDLCKKQRFSG